MRLLKTILLICLSFQVLAFQTQDKQTRNSSEQQRYENTAVSLVNDIEVYPNPSIDFVIVNIQNSTLVKAEFEIRSVIGNDVDVLVEQIGRDRYRIDVKEFTSGYYFLVVKDDQSQFKQAYKFLKK